MLLKLNISYKFYFSKLLNKFFYCLKIYNKIWNNKKYYNIF